MFGFRHLRSGLSAIDQNESFCTQQMHVLGPCRSIHPAQPRWDKWVEFEERIF